MACTNLTDILKAAPKLQEGVYLFKQGRWVHLTSNTQKESLEVYEETAMKIIDMGTEILNSKWSKNGELFIEKFNSAWTSALLCQRVIVSSKGETVIQFNSYNKYGWLSNFFCPTAPGKRLPARHPGR